MVIRLYETSDGEVLTKYVSKEKPVNVTKYVTAVNTKTVDAVKVYMKPTKIVTLTKLVPKTRFVHVTVYRELLLTRILSSIVSHISKGVVKGSTKLRGNVGGGRVIKTQPKNAPVRAMV